MTFFVLTLAAVVAFLFFIVIFHIGDLQVRVERLEAFERRIDYEQQSAFGQKP